MKIPRALIVHGELWEVTEVEGLFEDSHDFDCVDVDAYGIAISKRREIELEKTDTTEEKMETIFHELCHAACPDLTEIQVRYLEDNLYPVLIQNFRLIPRSNTYRSGLRFLK